VKGVIDTVNTARTVSTEKTMSADKRIPVTEKTHKELHELKEPGQTYDELLQELAQQRRREELENRFRDVEAADTEDLTALEDV
jgi:predicted CopG family antitoxin